MNDFRELMKDTEPLSRKVQAIPRILLYNFKVSVDFLKPAMPWKYFTKIHLSFLKMAKCKH